MLRQCCRFIVTGLGHPILLVTGLSYIYGPHAQPCLPSWLLGEPSSPGPVLTAQGWQSPWAAPLTQPSPPLPPALTLPPSTHALGQEPHNMAVMSRTSGPEAFNCPFL